MKAIRVMVVDDSATVRKVMTQVLSAAPDIEVIATAPDPLFALDKMKRDWPDVLVLDIEMPRMDGLTFLRRIMAERPTPVVICSSLTEAGAQTTLQALAAGAAAIVTKPRCEVGQFLQDSSDDVVAAVRAASRVNLGRLRRTAPPALAPTSVASVAPPPASGLQVTTDRVIAIGTSTGGTQALEEILVALPATLPGIVVVQHMPEKFTAAFAARLNSLCALEVREARHGDRVLPGRVLIAPGKQHMQLRRSGAQYHVEVAPGPPVNRHCPSVDVLFRSTAACAGRNALGLILTGMGDDGARGLLQMREAQADTIAQDEASCVVYGMPKEAVRLGAARRVLPLDAMAAAMQEFARRP
ncbi:MAG TPA: chemotaxis response regulator protein-glutamate methylesterase [Aquabacterium sp.]|nr:chemotaxis response regulator protein-glutamate methylesterase [Aquabacterium sp.]